MRIALLLIGIDDADNETSPAAGQLARRLAVEAARRGATSRGIAPITHLYTLFARPHYARRCNPWGFLGSSQERVRSICISDGSRINEVAQCGVNRGRQISFEELGAGIQRLANGYQKPE